MPEWMKNVNVNTMNRRNKIRLMHEIIEWSKYEMYKYSTYTLQINNTFRQRNNYIHVYNKKNKGRLERSYQFRRSRLNLLHMKLIGNQQQD